MIARKTWLVAATLGLLLATGATAFAAEPNPADQRLHEEAVAALIKGAPTEAIQRLELLSDRGVLHPDLSYDRAVSYVTRARSAQGKPGDLGRAAFALSEVLSLRPDDQAATALLERVDHELSKARSRRGAPSLLARDRLSRALVGLLSENTWAILSALLSAVATVGLWLRLGTKHHRLRLAGMVSISLGFGLLTLTALGLFFSMNERKTTRRGVVVAQEARLLDATGAALPRTQLRAEDRVIPEGARVLVKGRTDRLIQVEWGNIDAYVSPTELQLLPTRQ